MKIIALKQTASLQDGAGVCPGALSHCVHTKKKTKKNRVMFAQNASTQQVFGCPTGEALISLHLY